MPERIRYISVEGLDYVFLVLLTMEEGTKGELQQALLSVITGADIHFFPADRDLRLCLPACAVLLAPRARALCKYLVRAYLDLSGPGTDHL